MKKITLLLLLCTSISLQAQIGNPPLNSGNTYANRMQHIFGAIDKNKVTTGYLKEFGIRFNEVERHNHN